MGDMNSSDCSWKKLVIAKTNNKWSATMKSDPCDMDNSLNRRTELDNMTEMQADNPHDINFVSVATHFMNVKSEPESSVTDPRFQSGESSSTEFDSSQQGKRKGGLPRGETLEERATRLAKMSAYASQRLANESAEQRAARLKRMSEYAAKRLAHETSEQRAKRLSRMSAYAAKRLANESPEQRQARLARMSAYAAKRQAMKKVGNTGHSSKSLTSDDFDFTNISSVLPNQS